MKRILLLLALTMTGTALSAQDIVHSLEQDVPGQGRVRIFQDEAIANLLGKRSIAPTGGRGVMTKTAGYRIQAYAGNNTRQAKNAAQEVGNRVRTHFPELAVYTSFTPPRWLCRVGDFRSIEEANAVMRRMRSTGMFKEVSIVRDQINVSY